VPYCYYFHTPNDVPVAIARFTSSMRDVNRQVIVFTTTTQAGLPVDKLPNGQKFVEDFTKKYGQIQIYSPYSYDAVMVLVDAMKRANSVDPAKYLPEVGKTAYDGVTGKIEFDDKGDIKNGAITVFEIKDGKLVTLKTEGGTAPAAAAPAPAPEAKK
jgi:branched-chain amino acid transport system substrate-binding protein